MGRSKRRQASGATWIHVPARGVLHIEVLSKEPERYLGHWKDGRMRLCLGVPDCAHCRKHEGRQDRWCVSVYDLETRSRGLFEFGLAIASAMATSLGVEATLRGSRWALRKDGGRLRGRILVESEGQGLAPELMPAADNVAGALRRQWSDKSDVPGVGMPVRSAPSRYALEERAGRQPDGQGRRAGCEFVRSVRSSTARVFTRRVAVSVR